jgi:hypothetical protein
MEWQGYLHSLAPWEPEVSFREDIGDAESFKEFLKTFAEEKLEEDEEGRRGDARGKDEGE